MNSPMLSLFRAEWEKIASNRGVVIFLVWIFPLAAFFAMATQIGLATFIESYRETIRATAALEWSRSFLFSWFVINNEIGRFIIASLAAVIFAGEYQHGTWKHLITHRRRTALILNKFLTMAVYMLIALVLMTLVFGVGNLVVAKIAGASSGEFNGTIFAEFLGDYLLQAGTSLAILLIAGSYAAIAAIITGNIITAVLISILFTLGEQSIVLVVGFFDALFGIDIALLYQFMPTYNLANITVWAQSGGAFAPFGNRTDNPIEGFPVEVSILIILLWIGGLMALAVNRFTRQDITS